MNVGCCNEVEVTGLTTQAAFREGNYVKQNGTFYDRDYYKKTDPDTYLLWDGRRSEYGGRWMVSIFHLQFNI